MSTLSIGGSTWSTKLQRISELATRDKAVVFNNLGHIIDIAWLRELYRQLDGSRAIGIDGITKEVYGAQLEKNLTTLINRIRKGCYHPKPVRIVEIPKEDGSTRPLAISCFEDKLVQLAVSQILSRIYEPLFLPCSYGFRPNQNCHDALKALNQATFKFKDGAVVEIDIRKYFNTIPHGPLFEFLRKKINDSRFLQLLLLLVRTPTLVNGEVVKSESGSPQGSIVSPVLANIFLHHVIDEWFVEVSKSHLQGGTCEIRYADDIIFVFQFASQAERFYKVLGKRLNRYGLEMHEEKSRLLPSGNVAATRAHAAGQKIPVYKFLGFNCYWALSRNRKFWRLKFKSRGDRLRMTLQRLKEFLQRNLNNRDTSTLISRVIARVRGWVNYHAVSDNQRQVKSFIFQSRRALFRWLNRRGGGKCWNWERFLRLMERTRYPNNPRTVSLLPH